MAVDYLMADCRLMVVDTRIWSGRYVTTFQKTLLPPPRRCVTINDPCIYRRVEAVGSCDTSTRRHGVTSQNSNIHSHSRKNLKNKHVIH